MIVTLLKNIAVEASEKSLSKIDPLRQSAKNKMPTPRLTFELSQFISVTSQQTALDVPGGKPQQSCQKALKKGLGHALMSIYRFFL